MICGCGYVGCEGGCVTLKLKKHEAVEIVELLREIRTTRNLTTFRLANHATALNLLIHLNAKLAAPETK